MSFKALVFDYAGNAYFQYGDLDELDEEKTYLTIEGKTVSVEKKNELEECSLVSYRFNKRNEKRGNRVLSSPYFCRYSNR